MKHEFSDMTDPANLSTPKSAKKYDFGNRMTWWNFFLFLIVLFIVNVFGKTVNPFPYLDYMIEILVVAGYLWLVMPANPEN